MLHCKTEYTLSNAVACLRLFLLSILKFQQPKSEKIDLHAALPYSSKINKLCDLNDKTTLFFILDLKVFFFSKLKKQINKLIIN